MSAEIINLRRRRKQSRRADERREADASAAMHGRSKVVRALEEARADKAARDLEAHRREKPADDDTA